jgi:hypothetical protein
VQKVDRAKPTTPRVNSSLLRPEYLIHLVDVSVSNKYGTNLAQLTHALAENVRHTLDSYKQDLDNGLSR